VVVFTACTAARIGETSGVRRADINRQTWIWQVRRQTTPGPCGLIDKGTKGKRARFVPIITWMADAGVPVHVLRKIAGHGSITTAQRYLHPDLRSILTPGQALSAHLGAS
jgi:integrase